MFYAFLNDVFRKVEKITKHYINCLIIFVDTGFLESGGRNIAVAPIS